MTHRINFPLDPLGDVYVEDGYIVKSAPDNSRQNIVAFTDVLGLAREVRGAIVHKAGRLNGSEIAYLRKRMDLFQKELAKLIGTSEQALHLWESGKSRVPATEDAALRIVFIEREKTQLPKDKRKLSFSKAISLATPENAQFEYVGRIEKGGWTVETRPKPVAYSVRYVQHTDHISALEEFLLEPRARDTKVTTTSISQLEAAVKAFAVTPSNLDVRNIEDLRIASLSRLGSASRQLYEKGVRGITSEWDKALPNQQSTGKNVYAKAPTIH